MRTKLEAALLAIVLLVGGYASASWLIGILAQQRLQQAEQQLLDSYGYLTVVSRDYQRGIFRSTEDVSYGITGPMSQLLRASSAGRTLGSLRLTVHNTIDHGPLPRLRTAAFAMVDSRVQLPPELRRAASALLGGRPILQVHTTMRFTGVSDAVLESPAFSYRAPNGAQIVWRGISGHVRASRGLGAWSASLMAPGITAQDVSTRFELLDFSLSASMQRALGALYVGQSAFHLGTATFQLADGTAISVRGIAMQAQSGMDAGFFNERASLSADRLEAAQFSVTEVAYAQSLSHLHAASLAALLNASRDAQRTVAATGAGAQMQMHTEALRQSAFQLALHEPVLEIERLGFVSPDGACRLSAKMAVPGLTPEELQGQAATAAILLHLDASADLRIDAALLDKLLEIGGKRELLSGQLDQLERMGYLRRDGNAFATSIAFRGGKLTINGQSYPPIAATGAH